MTLHEMPRTAAKAIARLSETSKDPTILFHTAIVLSLLCLLSLIQVYSCLGLIALFWRPRLRYSWILGLYFIFSPECAGRDVSKDEMCTSYYDNNDGHTFLQLAVIAFRGILYDHTCQLAWGFLIFNYRQALPMDRDIIKHSAADQLAAIFLAGLPLLVPFWIYAKYTCISTFGLILWTQILPVYVHTMTAHVLARALGSLHLADSTMWENSLWGLKEWVIIIARECYEYVS
ncbi:hypothetical protein PT974_08649 [Cladobotryum mycophilum]|uniref:Uncharacterized protein n=1 Tax=Cladobotryum mycophilum TaxID=491253 RepID=A0ABR0SFB4_9HYPO